MAENTTLRSDELHYLAKAPADPGLLFSKNPREQNKKGPEWKFSPV
jgi:hypothetical protein